MWLMPRARTFPQVFHVCAMFRSPLSQPTETHTRLQWRKSIRNTRSLGSTPSLYFISSLNNNTRLSKIPTFSLVSSCYLIRDPSHDPSKGTSSLFLLVWHQPVLFWLGINNPSPTQTLIHRLWHQLVLFELRTNNLSPAQTTITIRIWTPTQTQIAITLWIQL